MPFRYGMLGISDLHIGMALVGLTAFVAILFVIAMHLLKTGKRLRA